jgi:DNA recombination protein RmuC
MTTDTMLWGIVILLIVLAAWAFWQVSVMRTLLRQMPAIVAEDQEERHRQMLTSLADQLAKQSHRLTESQISASDRVRSTMGDELSKTREAVTTLQLEQTQRLADNKEVLVRELQSLTQLLGQKQDQLKAEMLSNSLEKLTTLAREQTEHMQQTMRLLTQQVNERVDILTKTNDARLAEISGKVNERLDEGFKKTNETFANVMARLATIDEAQKKIDGLTSNVVSLQQLLGDKRSRGAFGEVQLEAIVANMLPANNYEFQFKFQNGLRADCVLKLPAPTGHIAIDSKFPLENFERMLANESSTSAFKTDVKKHIDDISEKYIIPGETGDGAMMFLPAEAVFAEIHAHHRDLIDHAARKRVWVVSPTTMMAVLNTALAVLKDVETRKQVHVIKEALGKLGADFGRFQSRMDDLSKHIGQVTKDVELVHISSRKISDQFLKIESVDLSPATIEQGAELPVLTSTRTGEAESGG